MNPTRIRLAVALATAVVAVAALLSILRFERILRDGEIVLLELAPVDPRSLMQGDYMALRFALDDELPRFDGWMWSAPTPASTPPPRYAYLRRDEAGRGALAGTGHALPAEDAIVAMRIRQLGTAYTIGPNAFFFEEGSGPGLEDARWGEFRVARNGDALLTHLRDAALERIGTTQRFADLAR